MTREQLATALERLADLPEEAHAELMASVDQIEAKYGGVYRLNENERKALERSREDMRQRRFATDQEVEAIFARHRHW